MADESVFRLFYYVLAALIIATAGGRVLRIRYEKSDAIANFQSRTYAWWVMVAVLALAMLAGRNVMLVLYAALSPSFDNDLGFAARVEDFPVLSCVDGSVYARVDLSEW